MQDGLPLRVSFADILRAVHARLVWGAKLPKSAVKLIARSGGSVPYVTGNQDILVKPSQFVSDVQYEEGGSRTNTLLSRTLYVFPRVRMARDQTDRDELWLTLPEGLFHLEETIIDVLQDWMPTDQSVDSPETFAGNRIVSRGIYITSGNAPEKNISNQPDWGSSCIAFQVRYLPKLDPGQTGIGPGIGLTGIIGFGG